MLINTNSIVGINSITSQNGQSLYFYDGSGVVRYYVDISGNHNITGSLNVTGSVSDSIGNVRSIPQNSKTSSYILTATDNGKHISITTGGVTVPSGVFQSGDNITIFNNSASPQTITSSGVTMYLSGTSTTGNRTLAQRGVATILCYDTNSFVIYGNGIT